MPVATDIHLLRAERRLDVAFDDGARFSFPAEYLRVESPSAEVQGHGPGQRVTVAGKIGVNIRQVDPIGHYAVRIKFDDGHDTGIYTWTYLHELAAQQATRWGAYLTALAEKGLRREP